MQSIRDSRNLRGAELLPTLLKSAIEYLCRIDLAVFDQVSHRVCPGDSTRYMTTRSTPTRTAARRSCTAS